MAWIIKKDFYKGVMKKFSVIALCLSCFACLLAFSACDKNKSYRTGVYEYIPDLYDASCNIMTDENIELHVERTASDSKREISDFMKRLKADYSKLENAFGLKTHIKCFVITDERALDGEQAIYNDGAIICNKDSLVNDDYARAFTAAYIRSTEPWKQYAAYAYAYNVGYDNDKLKRYYADGKDTELTLFSAYFIDEFSDTADIAIETAYSFGNFVINKYGYDNFIAANLTAYRDEYLKSLGLDRGFGVSFDLKWLDDAKYSRKFSSYPLVIKTANRVYNLDAFSSKRETASFDSPERVLYHLSAGNTECNKILNYIKDNAPDGYDFVSEKYADTIEYYISADEIKTCCDVDGRKIFLCDPSEFVHETVHAITLKHNPTDNAWIGEGIAEYLSRFVSEQISDINNRFYLSFTDKTLTGNIKEFVDTVNGLYCDRGGKFGDLSEFDFALLAECIGETTLKNNRYKSQIEFPYATASICEFYGCTSKDGNVLTYPEAYAFTKYLIEKYGFDKALKCCINYDPKGVFGADYAALINEYMSIIAHNLRTS